MSSLFELRPHSRFVALLSCFAFLVAPSAHAGETGVRSASDDFIAARPAASGEGAMAAGLASIRARSLGAHIGFLASPALEGRGLGSAGLEAAAEYVAATLAAAGVEPFGQEADADAKAGTPATYFQTVPLRALSEISGEIEVTRRDGARSASRLFRAGVDCRFAARPAETVAAAVVFAGFGIRDEKAGRDDYRGLDVRGKIVLILGGLPEGEVWKSKELAEHWSPEDPAERWDARRETAAALGAAALLAVESDPAAVAAPPDPATEEGYFRPLERLAAADPALVRVSTAVADELLAAAALDTARAASAAPRELPGVAATVRSAARERQLLARNVVGILRGSDPRLRDEALVLGAHFDHLGRVAGVVHPGADDNASGVAGLLEIARAFAASGQAPKRTLVFAFWTGEEEGKLGSGHYVRHPRWPLARTVAYLNFDMIGYPWLPEDVHKLVKERGLPEGEAFLAGLDLRDFVAPGLPPGAPALERALRGAAAATGLALYLDFTDGRQGGSDYRDFARAGVPFVRFVDNYGPNYHQSGDTPERLDAGVVERFARLAFATAWALAGSD
jgi:Zn-dependent M28 family amino/carboxypeptidase